jgi:hypothetical protein
MWCWPRGAAVRLWLQALLWMLLMLHQHVLEVGITH